MMREFLPISRDDMKKARLDELILSTSLAMPMWTTLLGPDIISWCWRPMAIKWVLFHSRTGKMTSQ